MKDIDLTGISQATLMAGWQQAAKSGYTFELHLDAPDGKTLAVFDLPGGLEDVSKKPFTGKALSSSLDKVTDGHLHDIYLVSAPKDASEPNQVGLQWIQFK
jgi:cytochrome c